MSSRGDSRKPQRGPLDRQRTVKYPCGLCGDRRRLTRTHIPPQCAGNTGLVARQSIRLGSGRMDVGPPRVGGIHFYGLCEPCNNLGSRYDGAYKLLSQGLQSLWIKDDSLRVPDLLALPDFSFRPGAVARSLVLSMFGVSPLLSERWPEFAHAMRTDADVVELPQGLTLFLALARGRRARVAGPISGFEVMTPHAPGDGRRPGFDGVVEVFFPPLAWRLVHATDHNVLAEQGWSDVSHWLSIPAHSVLPLHRELRSLPAVWYPRHGPDQGEGWVELLASTITVISEADLPS